jgi:MFS-type transporter involved in bile tolerance (Atg22 family)
MVFAAQCAPEVVADVKRLRRVLLQLLVVVTMVALVLVVVSVSPSWVLTAIVLVVAGAVLGLVGSDLAMLYLRRPKHSARRSDDVR